VTTGRPSAIGYLQSTSGNVTALGRGLERAEADDAATAENPEAEESGRKPASDAESTGLDLDDLQPAAAPETTDRPLAIVPDDVGVEAPEVGFPQSDDRTGLGETAVQELPATVAAARSEQLAEPEPDAGDSGRGDGDASQALEAVDQAKPKKRATLWRRTKRMFRRMFCCCCV